MSSGRSSFTKSLENLHNLIKDENTLLIKNNNYNGDLQTSNKLFIKYGKPFETLKLEKQAVFSNENSYSTIIYCGESKILDDYCLYILLLNKYMFRSEIVNNRKNLVIQEDMNEYSEALSSFLYFINGVSKASIIYQ